VRAQNINATTFPCRDRLVPLCSRALDLIEAPLHELDEHVAQTQSLMVDASKVVLGGFALRSDVKLVCYPERYVDERGVEMWDSVMALLDEVEAEPDSRTDAQATCAPAPRDL
jgi:hypothetical protein